MSFIQIRKTSRPRRIHYDDVIMGTIASEITSLTIVYSIDYSGADQRKHQSSASLAFVRGIHRTGEFPAQMASYAENVSIWWRHRDNSGVVIMSSMPSYQRLDCLLNRLFRARSQKTSKLRVIGRYERTSQVTGEFPAQRASIAENIFIWWRHHVQLETKPLHEPKLF